MKSWLKTFLVIILLCFSVVIGVYAQPGDPGEDPDVPLGGIELLLAAGALFGAKKWLDKGNKKS